MGQGEMEIAIDSGAADNVMPRGVMTNVELLEKEKGVGFAGANGSELGNYGRRVIEFVPLDVDV